VVGKELGHTAGGREGGLPGGVLEAGDPLAGDDDRDRQSGPLVLRHAQRDGHDRLAEAVRQGIG